MPPELEQWKPSMSSGGQDVAPVQDLEYAGMIIFPLDTKSSSPLFRQIHDKIREFIKLRERLSVSQHYSTVTVDRMLLDILVGNRETLAQMIANQEVDPEKEEIVWKDLTDNRDFQTMVSFDPQEK